MDEPQIDRLESHSLFDRAIHNDERLEHLFNVIRTMYKKKEGSLTENKRKFLKRIQRQDEPIVDFAMEMRDTLYHAWPGLTRNQLEDLLVDYYINGLYNQGTSAKLRIEGPITLAKAIDIAQIYEELLNSNTNLINKTEYLTPQWYSLTETPTPSPPISSGQPKIIKYMTQSAENFVTPTNIKSPQKSRTITLSSLETPSKGNKQRSILLNNVAIQYMADTGAGISVISEEVAKILNIEIKPNDKSKIKAVTADGKEVKDILGFAEVDVTIGNQTLERVKMLVFKNTTNPFLVGRDVLAVHPVTRSNFEVLINNDAPVQPIGKDLNDELREYLRTGKMHKCKAKHCEKSSENDGDKMEDLMYNNSNVKGCWSKNKSRIDQDAINTKVPINKDRKMCASKINNSIEKRTSIIENIYDCSKDHHCDTNRKEINALDYPTTPATTPTEGIILIRALEIIIEDSDNSEEELISENESTVISPDNSINTNNRPRRGR